MQQRTLVRFVFRKYVPQRLHPLHLGPRARLGPPKTDSHAGPQMLQVAFQKSSGTGQFVTVAHMRPSGDQLPTLSSYNSYNDWREY